MKPMKRVYVLVEVEVEKDINDLTDKVAGRVYTLDGVWNTTAKLLNDSESFTIASAWIDAEKKAQEGHQKDAGCVFSCNMPVGSIDYEKGVVRLK